jgi:hypothetical protein
VAIIWIAIGSWTSYGLTIKLDPTSVPTVINGITTSTSIVIGVVVAVLGIMYRVIMEKSDPKPKEFYLRAMISLMVPLFWLYTTYAFLTIGWTDFAVRYALSGLLAALYVCIVITIFTVTRIATEIDGTTEHIEPNKPKPEENKTTNQTRRKGRNWFSIIIASITLIALLISTSFNVYYAWRSDNLQNSINSLTYFQPFIFSINSTSTLNASYAVRNDTLAVLVGLVAVNLKVVTPYDGLLTINVKTLDFTRINELNSELDMNNLNFSAHSPSYLGTTIHQYFISRNVINSVEDKLLVKLTVVLKPNWISSNNTGIGFDLGDLTFEANLFAVQTNQTMTKTFFEDVYGLFYPTS